MSEKLRESVSALMDGEADEIEIRRLLAEDNSDLVRSTWSSYHLVRDSLQGNSDSQRFGHLEISQRVSEAIAYQELPDLVLPEKEHSSWFKTASGFAVAASVTVAVVLGVQGVNPGASEFNTLAASTPEAVQESSNFVPVGSSRVYAQGNAANVVSFSQTSQQSNLNRMPFAANEFSGVRETSQVIADFEAQKRLEKYILRHTERAALNNGQGMISFARVASIEPK